jgi:dihydrofolate reductase
VLKLSPKILRLVLTKKPQYYANEVIPNQLRFISAKPIELVNQLEEEGFTSMIVVGGSYVYSEFISAGLLNRFHITTEPVTLENGIPLTDVPNFLNNTKQIEHTILNARKTTYTLYEFNR